MPLAMKDFLFLLGILWVIFLFPGTSAYPTWDPSSELPFVIYPMNERTIYQKADITCNNSMKDNRMNLRRGVKCLSDDRATEVTVPLLHRDCRSPAKKLTITVNREDDVVIEFKKHPYWYQMEWRQDPNINYENIIKTDKSKLIVPHDKAKESGVYLFKKAENAPGASKECAVVIIRRECPANRYGDQCSHWCPDCMHRGICDAKTGKCVCPPGFKGEWCEEACEGDQILDSCTINPGVTSNTQICLPSPYGCSCAPGKKGYLCNADCDPGTWGVNCLQRCNHCVGGTCDKVTGKCSSGREDPCAGGPKGYLRFRQEPDVKPDEDKVTVTFVKEFDGEEPISKDIRYRVVIWEKDRSMNYMTTSKEVKDSKTATKMSVEIQGLAPATNYYAAVLVKFLLNDKVCEINGTLRGERIQKRLFTIKCPEGKMSNILQDWISQEGFNISWKEEAYAKHCNYTYEVKVERVPDGKKIYHNILKNPSHSQDGLETYTDYKVSIAVVSELGKSDPSTTTIKTLPKRPSQPINFEQSSSLTDIVITWNDHPDDKKFTLYYDLVLQNKTYKISKKEHKFTGLQAEHTYPLQIKSCNHWKCSDVLKKFVSTNPWPPEIEGSIELLDYSGNVSKMQLPRVKNPPAVQYVVVVEALENLNDTRIKELALQVVEKYTEEEEENNSKHRMSKRSTTEREPEIWVAGKYPIENATMKTVDVGTGEGENRPFQPEKNYNLVVVTEKKSGGNREFTVSDPVSTKGRAVASGRAGILVGVFIFVALIGLLAWTYKKRQTKVVARTANQDRDCVSPPKEGTLRRKPPLLRKSTLNPGIELQEFSGMGDEEIYYTLNRRIPSENIEPYLLKAIHSKETDMEFNSVPKVLEKSCSYSDHPENRMKNRYKNNLPYNYTRVKLPRLPQMPFSDYINANYIEGHLNPKAYIATQGPKDFNQDTTGDFWRMVWHTKSQMIIMIANVVENGKVKVAEYWPSEGTITKGGIDITHESTETEIDFIFRTFILTNNEEIRKIQQYQFTAWPDHGVPESPYGVAQMIHSIRREPLTGPIVVHCSAGIGRTGTILLVLGVMDQINNSGYMDVHEVLVKLRNGRSNLVENTAQYKFAHSVLQEILCEKQTRFTCQEFPEALLELRVPQDNTNMSRIQQQFQELKQLPKDLSYKFAKRPEVSHLNRDPNILPPDSSMIYLQYTSNRAESQYINAVSMQSMNGQEKPAVTALCHWMESKPMISRHLEMLLWRKLRY
ncbi:receptor-type tyrosine-protein phosphatase kappa-like [Palaemon carinicauda]|uniref:receptor-type tyrosine-protein phosphatase kappa-like n=1 Tax=Palaemon carinicauda TaxID=392227 RepID=UPI0035B5B9F1